MLSVPAWRQTNRRRWVDGGAEKVVAWTACFILALAVEMGGLLIVGEHTFFLSPPKKMEQEHFLRPMQGRNPPRRTGVTAMVATQTSKVFHCIRTVALRQQDGLTDGNLLDLYVQQKDEAAFEALVRRHGPMVLGVCRRILGNGHDAEDAFQATFLVLVRKAASIRPSGMVGNWLYGVAQRTALEARRSAARRRAKEAQVTPRTETSDDRLAHLRPVLDQELTRLPGKYRAVLVLCDLEGKTRKEAARQLGLPDGTIASRQARARTILAKRLTRRGVTLSGGALAETLAQEAASASAPVSLVLATVRAATAYAAGSATAAAAVSASVAALTEGVLRTMLLSKLKITVLLLVVIGLGGTGWGNYRTLANDQPAVQAEQALVAQADAKKSAPRQPKEEKAKKEDGKKAPDENKPQEQDQARQVLDLVRMGLQAYQASKERQPPDQDLAKLLWDMMEKSYRPPEGKKAGPADKEALDALLKASQLSFEIASEIAWEMAGKGYQPPDGKKAGPADKEALKQFQEAFRKALQLSSEIARADERRQANIGPENEAVFDAYGPAFVEAYERAKILKETLEEQKAPGDKRSDKAVEALDRFLKAGKELERTIKLHAKIQAVEHAKKAIESALSRVEKTGRDRQTTLEALDEIERAVQDMKKRVKDGAGQE
jgi:RNA polymerase sigma factor (sigma-70 family)